MALLPIFNPWAIMNSAEKAGTSPQQYVGITFDGTVKHYYANVPLGTGITLHREDGPALIWNSGEEFWYYEGIEYNNLEEIKRIIKLKAFL